MLSFFDDQALASGVAERLRSARKVDLAVAYWGKGAISRLALDKVSAPIRIICDPWKGCCNPEELRELSLLKNVSLHSLRGLHAKVYWTPKWALVGSANASTNGLGDSEIEHTGTIEAALCTDDMRVLSETAIWFTHLWNNSEEIKDFEQIEKLWRARRAFAIGERSTLLSKLDSNSGWFKDRPVRLLLYPQVTKVPKQVESRFQRDVSYSPYLKAKYNQSGVRPYYWDETDWKIEQGEWIIDYEIQSSGKVTFEGIWRIRTGANWMCKLSSNLRLYFADEQDVVLGLQFPKREQLELLRRLKRYAKTNNAIDKHGSILDAPFANLPQFFTDE